MRVDVTKQSVMHRLFPEAEMYKRQPGRWITEKLQDFFWSKQLEIIESVRDNRYTAVRSCHGSGKSFSAARIAAWWLDVHKVGEAFVVTTAPTWRQIQSILWREMRNAHRKAELNGRMTLEAQWYMGDNQLVAMGSKPADHDEHAFQGIHAKYVLVIVDEACGVPETLWTGVDTLVTNEHCRVLAIGNPDDPSAHFSKVMKPGSGWNHIHISAFDTPAFTGEKVPKGLLDYLINPTWVEERVLRWGIESPLYVSKVLGEFPEISDDTLIPPKLINIGMATDLTSRMLDDVGVYALDVARSGNDENVLCRNRGGVVRVVDSWRGLDLMQTAGRLSNKLGWKPGGHKEEVPAIIDIIGLGAGVYDRVKEEKHPARGFNASWSAASKKRFANRRAEVYWTFRERLERGEIDLPAEGTSEADDDLIHQLVTVKYTYDSKGRIKIEPKEDHAKRIGRSPDRADAAVMTMLRRPLAGKDRNPGREFGMELPTNAGDLEITRGLMEQTL